MIIKAAVKFYLYKDKREIIIPCHRHGDAFRIMKIMGYEPNEYNCLMQGFLTETDEFLDRKAAAEHANECGQLDWLGEGKKIEVIKSECLFSEDLW